MNEDASSNRVFHLKNFNMGIEIDIAGTFLYNGMKELNRIQVFSDESEIFYFLYQIAVGIERLQKVLLVMLEELTQENADSFEESLRNSRHHHGFLHERILEKCKISFNKREICFLALLDDFYNNDRYIHFSISGRSSACQTSLCQFIKSHSPESNLEEHSITNDIVNNKSIRSMFGCIVGTIAKKYYEAIKDEAYHQNLYTYELRYESPAQKILLPDFRKNSFQEQTFNEQIALKEFIIYLVNTKDMDPFFKHLKGIDPLDFDIALVNEHLEALCKGIISQSLVDEVESMYDDLESKKKRLDVLYPIGNTDCFFQDEAIEQLFNLMKSVLSGEMNCISFASDFCNTYSSILDGDARELLNDINDSCVSFLHDTTATDERNIEFIAEISKVFSEFCHFFALECEVEA